jgi:hypothetical protein
MEMNKKVRVITKVGADGAFYFKLGFLKKYIGFPPVVWKNTVTASSS